MKNRWITAVVGIIMLAACGEAEVATSAADGVESSSENSTTTQESVANEAEDGSAQAANLRQFFEANPWRIVDRAGFDTTLPDGLVAFEIFGPDAIITLQALPCGRWGGSPIEWNDQGFMLTDTANTEGGVVTEDIQCGPGDDLFDLLARGLESDQFVATISDNGTTATLRKGDRTLTLAPTTTDPPSTTAAPPVTEAVATTTTVP